MKILGRAYRPDEFAAYLQTLKWTVWKPSLVVIHHCAAPSLAQRPHGFIDQHMRNLQDFYESKGWSAGPHLFVDDDQCTEVPDTGFEGECVVLSQTDGCSGENFSTCPDGVTRVYFSELGLEIGAVEVVAFDAAVGCPEAPAGFEPCVMIDGDPVTYDAPECECLCPA